MGAPSRAEGRLAHSGAADPSEDEPLIPRFPQARHHGELRVTFPRADEAFFARVHRALTQLDYARAMAFVAFEEESGDLAGVVRLHSDSIYETGEYAILLRSDLKGRGLAGR